MSYIGNWMQVVGVGWLLATLTPSPTLISMAQGATHLALFLCYLPAGVAADFMDRRKLLLFSQSWMLSNAAMLALVTLAGAASVALVLITTFLIGLGAAMAAPAWQASIPDFVPENELPAAVALESVALNIARAAGPALGGLAFLFWGPGAVFAINALSFLGIAYAIWRWQPQRRDQLAMTTTFTTSLVIGIRRLFCEGGYRPILARTFGFTLFASCIWTLIPVVIRDNIHGGAVIYGIALCALGIGAVVGAMTLPFLRSRNAPDRLFVIASLAIGGSLLAAATTRNYILLDFALVPGGAAWLITVATLTVPVVAPTPPQLRGRMLAGFLAVFSAGYTAGSLLWGVVATHWTASASLIVAGGGVVGAALVTSTLCGAIVPTQRQLPTLASANDK
jgi:predicted MFS family arabinose efflux permease